MKVTGYKLREALRRWTLRRDAALSQFEGSLHKFASDTKATPVEVAARISVAEGRIAALQLAQALYNQRVSVTINGRDVLLLAAVKAIGPLTRSEKRWRAAAGIGEAKRSRLFSTVATIRTKDAEQAVATITADDAAKLAENDGRELALVREVIAAGNTREVDIEHLDAALLE